MYISYIKSILSVLNRYIYSLKMLVTQSCPTLCNPSACMDVRVEL